VGYGLFFLYVVDTMSEKKRLMYVNYSLAMGGIERMIVEFVNRFKGEFSIQVAVFEAGGGLERVIEEQGVPVFSLDKKEGIDTLLIYRLIKLFKKSGVEIVHTNNFNTWFYVSIAALACPGLVTVHTEHSLVRGEKFRRFFIERILSHLTKSVIAVSEDVRQLMINKASIAPSQVRVIQNGINVRKFAFSEQSRLEKRKELGVGSDMVVYGAVGRLVEVKDHATLIHSFSKHLDDVGQGYNSCLVIIGDGRLRGELNKLISSLGLESVVFIMGERHDVVQWLSAFDVYCMSSLSEGMSISLLEAMSAGLPVLATSVGGNVELVENNANGLLVQPQNIQSFLGAMNRMQDGQLRRALGRAGREFVLSEFSDTAMLGAYKECYLGLN